MDQISELASQIRSANYSPPNNPNVLSISTSLLSSLLISFEMIEERSSSTFLIKPGNNLKLEQTRDLQFLDNFFKQTKTLKIYEDVPSNTNLKDLSKFKNLSMLEFCKVDINTVQGIQLLRPQLQKLSCHQVLNTLSDVLDSCGGDESSSYCWNELKEIIFTNSDLVKLDRSLECVPWLHSLNLSHNQLRNVDDLSCLHNLKHLNLSFNKLEDVPRFSGQMCSRLQNLILKNNFIEDITALQLLTNISVLDLSNNCIVDHNSLLPLSMLATLQWLNLTSNPLFFHPLHRIKVARCLHANTSSAHFVLNHATLTYIERKVIGSLYPKQPRNNSNSLTDSISLTSEKACKVRHVVIEEEKSTPEINVSVTTTKPQPYLETKKQIEDLRQQYGESWLNSHSGLLLQNVLGLESSLPISSSPYEADFTLHSNLSRLSDLSVSATHELSNQAFTTAFETTQEEPLSEASIESDGDLELEGEEFIYLATIDNDADEPIFVVISQTHIAEKECSTGKERLRWHINSINKCEILPDRPTTVQVDFDTMRKDRKQRVYTFDEDVDQFVSCIKDKIDARQPKKDNNVKYQCMKCSTTFKRTRNESVLGGPSVKCPTCDSNLVVEE